MPLENYNPMTTRIPIGENGENGYLVVRGIGFPEVAQLIEVNATSIAPLFDRATGKNKENPLTMESLDSLPFEFLSVAPHAACHLIALAADEPITEIVKLPFDVQFDALFAIGTLTFKSVGGARNFLERAAKAMVSVTALGEELKRHPISINSSKDSKKIDRS